MINKIIDFFKPKKWQYIGCTKARAIEYRNGAKFNTVGELTILYFTCGNLRKIKKIKWGDPSSNGISWIKADAKAWLNGGDLPLNLEAAQ